MTHAEDQRRIVLGELLSGARHLEDFEPENVVRQVEPLRKLLEARQRLTDLKSKLDGNDKLEDMLTKVLNNPDDQSALKDAIGVKSDDEKAGE